MKVGDIVKIFAASQHPPALVIAIDDGTEETPVQAGIMWNNKLIWVPKENLEVINER